MNNNTAENNIGDTAPIIENELSYESLKRVIDRKTGVIHIRNFYDTSYVQNVIDKVINHSSMGYYNKKYTSSVGRLYTPHIDQEWDQNAREVYQNEATKNIHDIRSLFYPYPTPIDNVRLLLQELWPKGANIQQTHGRNCFVGTFRVFKPEISTFYPHHDRIDEETDAPEIKGLVDQLVANVYIETPDVGGDLELWLRDPTDIERARIRDVEGLMRDSVEPPALTIKVKPGDLTIFSTQLLHAVTPGHDKYRIGMAAFLGCYGEDRPLTYWS